MRGASCAASTALSSPPDDINALSNFVADAPRVLGFDPFARLADWLEREQPGVEAQPVSMPSGIVEGATIPPPR